MYFIYLRACVRILTYFVCGVVYHIHVHILSQMYFILICYSLAQGHTLDISWLDNIEICLKAGPAKPGRQKSVNYFTKTYLLIFAPWFVPIPLQCGLTKTSRDAGTTPGHLDRRLVIFSVKIHVKLSHYSLFAVKIFIDFSEN